MHNSPKNGKSPEKKKKFLFSQAKIIGFLNAKMGQFFFPNLKTAFRVNSPKSIAFFFWGRPNPLFFSFYSPLKKKNLFQNQQTNREKGGGKEKKEEGKFFPFFFFSFIRKKFFWPPPFPTKRKQINWEKFHRKAPPRVLKRNLKIPKIALKSQYPFFFGCFWKTKSKLFPMKTYLANQLFPYF